MTKTPEPTLAELRKKSEASEAKAKQDKAALLEAAVKEAMTSTAYGHVSAVARQAGIASQYLRTLIEEKEPGWLDRAAEEREAAKRTAKEGGGKPARRSRRSDAAA